MEIQKIKYISKEEIEKMDKEELNEKFLKLQDIAIMGNEIIQKQIKIIEMIAEEIKLHWNVDINIEYFTKKAEEDGE